jgi:hypothetical protein
MGPDDLDFLAALSEIVLNHFASRCWAGRDSCVRLIPVPASRMAADSKWAALGQLQQIARCTNRAVCFRRSACLVMRQHLPEEATASPSMK